MAEHRPDFQPPRLDPLVVGPPRFSAGARTLLVAGMVGACAMGAVAGSWARPGVNDLKQAKEPGTSAAKTAPARPVLQIVDADLMPPPAERLEVLPTWLEAPIPPAVDAGPLRKVVLEPPAPVPPPPEPKPKAKAQVEANVLKAERPKQMLVTTKTAAEETPKPRKAKAEPKQTAKLVKAKADEPRPIKAKVAKSKPKPEAKKTSKVGLAKTERPKASKLRVALSSLKPAKEAKQRVVAAASAKPNKVEKVQKELAALPVVTKNKIVVAQAMPKTKRAAPEQTSCAARSHAEALLCESPQLAAAERRLAQAYREAAEAGAPEWRLRRQQNRWLAARERAADEAPWAVTEVYDARIAELEDEAAMARERF